MAAKELYDYLQDATPDKVETLSVNPSHVNEIITRRQEVLQGDGRNEEVLDHSPTDPTVYVDLIWNVKNESDTGTVWDFYNDTAKGNGRAFTFIWNHPTDGHQYVVRFAEELQRERFGGGNPVFSISCLLKVIGYYTP